MQTSSLQFVIRHIRHVLYKLAKRNVVKQEAVIGLRVRLWKLMPLDINVEINEETIPLTEQFARRCVLLANRPQTMS